MRIEDQGQWERCASTRRMFLALTGTTKSVQLRKVAEGLLRMAHKHMPGSEKVEEAQEYWFNGLRDENDKEQADRAYLVIRYVVDAVDELPGKAWSGGGEVLVCAAIRKLVPLAPGGFSSVGDRVGVGGGSVQAPSPRATPISAVFRVSH